MWSDSFRAEERQTRAGRGHVALSVTVAGSGLIALVAEVVFATQVAGDALSRSGWWPVGLVSIGLGLVGPYATLLTWRARSNAIKEPHHRLTAAGLVAVVTGLVALSWLDLIHHSLPPNLHLF